MSQIQPSTPSRSSKGPVVFTAWVLAVTLILGAVAFLVFSLQLVAYNGPLTPIVSMGVGLLSLPFFVRWSIKRDERWALLAWWVFFSLAVLLGILALEPAYSQVLLMLALLQVAVPFAVLFFTDRARWWAAIPAYSLVVISGLVALTIFNLSLEIIGAFALLAVALPLWLLYMLDRSNVWAIVPAAIISGIAIVLLVAFSLFQAAAAEAYVIVNATLAVLSIALWLTVRRLDWAVWLGAGFTASAVISVILPEGTWAMLALTTGAYIIYRLIRMNRPAKAPATSRPVSSIPANPPVPAPPTQSTVQQPPAPTTTGSQPASIAPNPAQQNPHWRAIMADKAASEAAADQPGEKNPVTGFRPLDPLADRNPDDEPTSSAD